MPLCICFGIIEMAAVFTSIISMVVFRLTNKMRTKTRSYAPATNPRPNMRRSYYREPAPKSPTPPGGCDWCGAGPNERCDAGLHS